MTIGCPGQGKSGPLTAPGQGTQATWSRIADRQSGTSEPYISTQAQANKPCRGSLAHSSRVDVLAWRFTDDQAPHVVEELLLGEVAVIVTKFRGGGRCVDLQAEASPYVIHQDVFARDPSAAFLCGSPRLPPRPHLECQV